MTCENLSSLISERPLGACPAELRSQAETHLAGCANCRGLAETIDGIKRMPAPHSLFAPKEIAPVRPMPSRAWFIAVALLLTVILAAAGVWWKGAYGWNKLPQEAAVLYVILGAIGLGALALGFYRQFKPGARDTIDGRAAMVILLAGFVAFAAVEFGWHPKAETALRGAWGCFRYGTTVALGAALALLSWARLGFAANPVSASYWTGALASMAGMIALAIHCPNLELSHLLMGHASVILLATVMVAWTGRRLFGLR